MRLWHKDLIPVLPAKHLLAQWRECCAIISNIDKRGTPNHMLVNKVLNYPPLHFILYTNAILSEMQRRGYKISEKSYVTLSDKISRNIDKFDLHAYMYVPNDIHDIFRDWHNDRYLRQCFYNLQEKYDCGAIPKEEWYNLYNYAMERFRGHN